ncbi:MAG: hypothetical protein ABJJ37_23085 [Roseibium sp.]
MANVYRFFNTVTGSHFFTTSEDERNNIIATNPLLRDEGIAFVASDTATAGTNPVYRLFNSTTGKHLFTAGEAERDNAINNLGFVLEKIEYYATTSSDTASGNTTAVYRFLNTTNGSHFYTASTAERDNILATLPQFTLEGIGYYAMPAPGAANTITLTTNTDSPGAAAPAADTQGTSGADAYSALIDSSGGSTTLSNADSLDGAGGTDSLNLRIVSTTNNETVAPVSTNVEEFNFTNQVTTGNDFVLNFQNITGETKVADVSSTGTSTSATRVINVDSSATAAMTSTLGTFQVNFSGTRTGTTDAFTLELNGAGSSTTTAQFATVTSTGGTDNSFEVVNISSSSNASTLNFDDTMTLSTVNVSGDAALTLTENSNFSGLKTVDANTFTASLMIDARGSTESGFSFTGGSADDRILLANNTVSSATTLNGNGGTDTLATSNINTLTAATVNAATNFEVLEDITGAGSFTASDFTSINSFLFSTASTNSRATMSGIESSDTIAISSDITYGGDEGLRLTGNAAGTTANLELRATSATNGEVAITSNNNNNDVSAIGLETNISTLNLSSTLSSGTQTNVNLIKGSSSNDNSYGIENSNVANVNISGSHALTINAEAGTSLANGQQVYGFSSGVNADGSSFTGVLRIAGSASADTIQGGAAADIIYGLGGADVMTGNGGADQFRHAHYNNSVDRITDFTTGTDKIGLNQIDFGNTTASQAGTTLNTADYITNVASITTIGGGAANTVIELQSSQSTSDMTNNTGSAVAAYVLVHNSTTGKGELWYDADWSTTGSRSHLTTFDNVTSLTGIQAFSNTDFVEYSF